MQQLLLLHGALGAESQFANLRAALSGHFEVHTLNFSGHGGLDLPATGYSMDLFAQNVQDYLREKGLKRVACFGYSMGGFVALHLASKAPECFSGIFTLASKLAWSPEIANRETRFLNPTKIKEKVPAYAKHLQALHEPAEWEQVVRLTAQMMHDLGANNPLNDSVFQEIDLPVRVSIGDRDQMVSLEETVNAYQQLPNSSFQVFPNTPHPLEKVDTGLLAQALIRYFTIEKGN